MTVDPMGSLTGRTALITGAASGIGRACAEAFSAAGAEVIAVDRDADALDALVSTLPTIQPVVCDLSDLEAVDELPARIDILINNAGIQHVAPIEEFPPEMFDLIHRLMLGAPFRLIRRAMPHMKNGGWGRIVNISSVHGLRASPFKAAYVSAKHGLEGLSKVVALEGAEAGVTSNCICPAYVRTALVEKQIDDQARVHGISADRVVAEIMLEPVAVKRLVEPAEVADLAWWLCGPTAASVTGASFPMDGGWTAR